MGDELLEISLILSQCLNGLLVHLLSMLLLHAIKLHEGNPELILVNLVGDAIDIVPKARLQEGESQSVKVVIYHHLVYYVGSWHFFDQLEELGDGHNTIDSVAFSLDLLLDDPAAILAVLTLVDWLLRVDIQLIYGVQL